MASNSNSLSDIGFDSKLVRLKARMLHFSKSAFRVFRFQIGAIKRYEKPRSMDGGVGFDSKLVRLKVSSVAMNKATRNSFRFQIGAIKRGGFSLLPIPR